MITERKNFRAILNRARGKWQSERAFSLMLAEELLRAELQKLYGNGIKLFRCKMVATMPTNRRIKIGTCASDSELAQCNRPTRERYVEVRALIGPFGSSQLLAVSAICRLFNNAPTTTAVRWQPHLFYFVVENEQGHTQDERVLYYEGGYDPLGVLHSANAENPCADMVNSQMAANHASWHFIQYASGQHGNFEGEKKK